MYKFISWYLRHLPFPHRGWKYFRAFLQRAGLYEKRFTKKLHNGLLYHVHPADHIQQQILWYGYYEKEAVLCWEALAVPGSVVLDIGANTGYYSLIAAAKGATVFAFEPASAVREELIGNIGLNPGLSVTPVAAALGNKEGTADLYLAGPDNRGMSGFHVPDNFTGQRERVSVMTADAWATQQGLTGVDLLKIDTEGAEMEILSGMQLILEQFRPVLFIEVMQEHLERSGQSVNTLYATLSALHYEAYLPVASLTVKRLAAAEPADVVIFYPREKAWPAAFRIQS